MKRTTQDYLSLVPASESLSDIPLVMRFFVVVASLVAAAAAQGIAIFNPTSGSTLTPGQNVTVSVVESVRSFLSLYSANYFCNLLIYSSSEFADEH